MKTFRIIAAITAMAIVFSLSAAAAPFTPSIERKDEPKLVDGDEDLILTPISDYYDEDVDLHEDIEENLAKAEKELDEKKFQDILENFEELWNEATKGAPVEHAIISDIFDVRLETELGDGKEGVGVEISFKIEVLGIEADDVFMLIVKENDGKPWKALDYEIDENGVITIKVTTKSVLAVVKDNEAPAPIDPDGPDSPQTGVPAYYMPAVVGIVMFGALAAVFTVKLARGKSM